MTDSLLKYPWLHRDGEYINVDIKLLPFPIDVEGFDHYKNYEALREGFFNWSPSVKARFCREVKKGSKTCDVCNKKYVDSTKIMEHISTCVACLQQENGREERELDAEEKKNKAIAARHKLRDDFIKVLDGITYPLKFVGFTLNTRAQVAAIWAQAGQRKNQMRNKRNLITNLRDAIEQAGNKL